MSLPTNLFSAPSYPTYKTTDLPWAQPRTVAQSHEGLCLVGDSSAVPVSCRAFSQQRPLALSLDPPASQEHTGLVLGRRGSFSSNQKWIPFLCTLTGEKSSDKDPSRLVTSPRMPEMLEGKGECGENKVLPKLQ